MSLRIERLKEVIREEAAETITQDLSDPRIGFCTVTKIELSGDLAYCTVHVSVIGTAGVKSRTLKALKSARGLIQAKIAKRLAEQTLYGAGCLLHSSEDDAGTLREKVTSRGGVTEAALRQYREDGLPDLVKRAIRAAVEKSAALGQ